MKETWKIVLIVIAVIAVLSVIIVFVYKAIDKKIKNSVLDGGDMIDVAAFSSLSYTRSGGELNMYESMEFDEYCKLVRTFREENGAPVTVTTYQVPEAYYNELRQLLNTYQVHKWQDLPVEYDGAADDYSIGMSVEFQTGLKAFASGNSVLPEEGKGGLRAIRETLMKAIRDPETKIVSEETKDDLED